MATTPAPNDEPPMTAEQLRNLHRQAEQAPTLEECAAFIRQMPAQYHAHCQPLLTKKAVGEYQRMGLEEVLQSSVIKEYGLNKDEIKERIQRFYLSQICEGFSQLPAAYSAIERLEPPQAMHQYQAILDDIKIIDRLRQRYQDDFRRDTIPFESEEGPPSLEVGLHRFAVEVHAHYLDFQIRVLPNRELATDDFDKKYLTSLATINQYTETANSPKEAQESLDQFLDQVDENYQKCREEVKPEIEREQDYWYKLCILTKAQGDWFKDDGGELFNQTFAHFRYLSLRYSKLLGVDEEIVGQTRKVIEAETLRMRATNLRES